MGNMSISSKGQVVIPKDVRQRLGFKPGARLEFIESGGELRLRLASRPGKTATVAEGLGLAGYKGPPVSIDEMNDAVRRRAAREDNYARKAGR